MKGIIKTLSTGGKAFNVKEYRKEASRLAAIANKRLQRIEKNNLQDSPAYKRYISDKDGAKFGIKGKDFNQVQAEVAKLNRFLGSDTSTIRGINKTLKAMADNTGIQYSNMKDLKAKSDKFFALSDQVMNYLQTVENMGAAINYNEVWDVINEYVKTQGIDLADADQALEQMTSNVVELINNQTPAQNVDLGDDWVFLD